MTIKTTIFAFGLSLSVATFAGNIVANPSADQAISQPLGTSLNVNKLDHVVLADQYAAGSNTGGIQEAINNLPSTGGVVYLASGTYTLTSGITISSNHVVLMGNGDATVITTANSSITALTISASSVKIYDVRIQNTATAPTGTGIVLSGTNTTTLRGIHIQGFNDSIRIASNGSVGTFNVHMSDFVLENASHSAIFLNTPGGGDFFANAGQVSIGPGSVGVLWADDSGVNISDVQITGGIAGVQISPSTGQFASWGFFHNVVAQNQIGTPWAIIPGVGGQVNGITADSCSAISGITNGVLVGGNGTCSSGSIVDGFRWIGGRISGNGYNGVEVVNAGCVVQNIAIQNSDISGNSATYTQLYNGVTVGAGISHFSVVGNRIGPDANQAERQAYAVVVPPGLSDYYIIVGNDLSGNLTGGLSNGGTGKHTAVGDNVGQ